MSEIATASAVPPLPPGYTLDKIPPLPPGYTLDQGKPAGEYGYAAAPPEMKPPASTYDDDQGGTFPSLSFLPSRETLARSLPNTSAGIGALFPNPTPTVAPMPPAPAGPLVPSAEPGAPWRPLQPAQQPAPSSYGFGLPAPAPGAWGRVAHAADEGVEMAPDASGWHPGGVPLGQIFINPLLQLGSGLFRAGQQVAKESIDPVSPRLARDVSGFPEMFPMGVGDLGAPVEGAAAFGAERRAYARASADAGANKSLNRGYGPTGASVPNQLSPSEIHAAIPPEATPPVAAAPTPPPAPGVPTHMYQGDEAVYPVTPTGNEQTLPDGRVYAEVREPGHPPTWVRKDRVLPSQGEGAPVIQPPPQAVPPVEPPPPVPAIPAAPRNALAPDFVGPEETVAAPAPEPSSAGAAATPPAEAGLTPAQSAAAGSTADKQRLYRTRVPGEADNAEYIQGITPTRAQAEQTVNAARDSKLLRRISPDAEQNERNLLAEHTDIRKNEFQNIAGSDTTQQADLQAANDRIETQLQAAYAHGGTVDMQPVIDAVNAELSGSAGKLPPVRSAMQEILNAAQRADGAGLENTPLGANAVRRAIIYMQSNDGRNRNLGYGSRDAMAAMTRVKDALTRQIEPAAPGFTEANASYARARQAIDAREKLQEVEPKLYDSLGNMRYLAFHKMMGDIVAARDPRAPLGPYKALTEAQMNRLWSIHDDLRRASSAEDLAKANGSDTTQTLFDMARRAVKHSVGTAAGMGVGILASKVMGADVGVGAGMAAREMINHLFDQRAVNKATAEHARMLRPDPALTTPNPYALPPSAP